jgi:hypothetical protein
VHTPLLVKSLLPYFTLIKLTSALKFHVHTSLLVNLSSPCFTLVNLTSALILHVHTSLLVKSLLSILYANQPNISTNISCSPSPLSKESHHSILYANQHNISTNVSCSPVSIAERSKACTVYDRLNTEITGSNHARAVDVCLLASVLCCPVCR